MKYKVVAVQPDLHKSITEECKAVGISTGALIRMAFGQWLRNGKKLTREEK